MQSKLSPPTGGTLWSSGATPTFVTLLVSANMGRMIKVDAIFPAINWLPGKLSPALAFLSPWNTHFGILPAVGRDPAHLFGNWEEAD